MPTPTPAEISQGVPSGEDIVVRKNHPQGGQILVSRNGGVFAINGAPFAGSIFTAVPQGLNSGQSIKNIEIDPKTGGYTLIADDGARFAFNTPFLTPKQAQTRDKNAAEKAAIFKDPAFLAFIRNADITVEEAARQVARQQGALESALAVAEPEIRRAGERQTRSIGEGFEARGVFRSGRRLEDQAESERQVERDITSRRADVADQIAAGRESLVKTISDIQRQATEKGFNVAQTQDIDKRLEAVRRKFPAQFAGSGG